MNGRVDKAVDLSKAYAVLHKVTKQSRSVLRNAVNDTAGKARKRVDDKARETYTIKKAAFNKAMGISKATNATLTAHIKAKGRELPLTRFKFKKNVRKKGGRGATTQIKVKGTFEAPNPNHGKAFVIGFAIGKGNHGGKTRKADTNTEEKATKTLKGIFQRKGGSAYPIEQNYGPSVPEMLKDVDVYGTVEPNIKNDLWNEVNRQIGRMLGK